MTPRCDFPNYKDRHDLDLSVRKIDGHTSEAHKRHEMLRFANSIERHALRDTPLRAPTDEVMITDEALSFNQGATGLFLIVKVSLCVEFSSALSSSRGELCL